MKMRGGQNVKETGPGRHPLARDFLRLLLVVVLPLWHRWKRCVCCENEGFQNSKM